MSGLSHQQSDVDGDTQTEVPRFSDRGVESGAANGLKFQSNSRRGSVLYDAENDMIFALDEDSRDLDANLNSTEEKWNDSDEDEFNLAKITPRKQKADPQLPLRYTRHPSTSLAISLPVDIMNAVYARNGSLPDEEDELDNNEDEEADSVGRVIGRPRPQAMLSTREDRMYRNMQAYSRSIQPADDPERLFGERPHRRYRPTEQSGDGSNNSNDHFAVPSVPAYRGAGGGGGVGCVRVRGGCSLAAVPMAPVIANDLNLIPAGGGASNNNSANSVGVSRPRIIVPSSYSGKFY